MNVSFKEKKNTILTTRHNFNNTAPGFGNVFDGNNKRSIDQSVTLIESLIIVQIEANS